MLARTDDPAGAGSCARSSRLLAAGLTLAAVLWSAAILGLPFLTASGSTPVIAPLVHGAGAIVCHQRPERSFHVRGQRLAVCARCAALYLAGACGALAGWFGAGVPRRARGLLALAAAATAVTVGVEIAQLASPSNLVRAASAVPLGAFAGWLFVRMLRAGERPHMGYHSVF